MPDAVEGRMGEANGDGDKPAAARHPKYRSSGTGDAAIGTFGRPARLEPEE